MAPATRGRSSASAVAPTPATKKEAVQQLADASDTQKVEVVLRLEQTMPRDQVLAVVNSLASPDNTFIKLLSATAEGQTMIDEVIHRADALASKALLVPNIINGLALGIPGILIGFARRAFNMTTFTGVAIKQVFGIEFEQGSWSFEALRKMYLAFRLVPKTHVKGAVEKMTRNERTVSSDFGSKDKSINMARLPMFLSMGGAERGMRVGNTRWMGKGGLSAKFLMKSSPYSQAMRSKNAFSMTALHEVGHAVDNKLSVMKRFQSRPDFGGWEEYGSEKAVIEAMMKNLKIVYPAEPPGAAAAEERAKALQLAASGKDLKIERRRELRQQAAEATDLAKQERDVVRHGAEDDAYGINSGELDTINAGREKQIEDKRQVQLNKGNQEPDNHDSVTKLRFTGPETVAKAVFAGDKAKMAAFNNHPIMKAWNQGKKEMAWGRSRAELAETADAFGGRSFHQSYGHQWVSFNVAAKDSGVSHYAFRAPGEWFAELYAHYYMGTLKDTGKEGEPPGGHPMYEWFHQAIHKDEANRPDGEAAKERLRSPDQLEQGNAPAPVGHGDAAAEAAVEAVDHAGPAAKGGEGEADQAPPPPPVVEESQQAKAGGGAPRSS